MNKIYAFCIEIKRNDDGNRSHGTLRAKDRTQRIERMRF